MGTDIHLFVETRETAGAPWRLTQVKSECTWCNGSRQGHRGEVCYGCKGTGMETGYDSRNYDVFAMLANVRNGRGFAGIDTGDGFIPIDDPRGLPDDLCPELRRVVEADCEDEELSESARAEYGASYIGDHSFSHVYLRELLDYNWNRRTNHRGVVTAREFENYLGTGKPKSYSGDVSGQRVYHVSNKVMAAYVECVTEFHDADKFHGVANATVAWNPQLEAMLTMAGVPVADMKLKSPTWEQHVAMYTAVQWSESYKESAGTFYQRFVPALSALGCDPSNVRIVFGFDS